MKFTRIYEDIDAESRAYFNLPNWGILDILSFSDGGFRLRYRASGKEALHVFNTSKTTLPQMHTLLGAFFDGQAHIEDIWDYLICFYPEVTNCAEI